MIFAVTEKMKSEGRGVGNDEGGMRRMLINEEWKGKLWEKWIVNRHRRKNERGKVGIANAWMRKM